MCQMGCNGAVYDSKMCLYEHFFKHHSFDELKGWGINLEVLEAEFGKTKWVPDSNYDEG